MRQYCRLVCSSLSTVSTLVVEWYRNLPYSGPKQGSTKVGIARSKQKFGIYIYFIFVNLNH